MKIEFTPDRSMHSYPNFLREDAPKLALKVDFDRWSIEPVAVAEVATNERNRRVDGAVALIPSGRGLNDLTLFQLMRSRSTEIEEGTSFGMVVAKQKAEVARIEHSLRYLKNLDENLTWAFFRRPFRYGRLPRTCTVSAGRDFSRLYERFLADLFEDLQDRSEESDEPLSGYAGCLEDVNILFVNFLMKRMTIRSTQPWTTGTQKGTVPLLENLAAYALLKYLDLLPASGHVELSMLSFPLHAQRLHGKTISEQKARRRNARHCAISTYGSSLAI